METFKEIKATFKGIGKDEYKGKTFDIMIQRRKSGAHAYGDRSAHTLKFNDGMAELYDTRYDGISTNKDEWIKTWVEFLLRNYLVSDVELLTYEEKEIEMAE